MITVMPRALSLQDVPHGFGHLGSGESRHQLVEQEQFRLGGKRPGHLEALLVGQREVPGGQVLERSQVDELEGLLGLLHSFRELMRWPVPNSAPTMTFLTTGRGGRS